VCWWVTTNCCVTKHILKTLSQVTKNIFPNSYQYHAVKVVCADIHYLLLEPYGTHKYAVWQNSEIVNIISGINCTLKKGFELSRRIYLITL
jgi:hypothetical protein